MATFNHLLMVSLILSFSAFTTAAESGTATFYTPPYTPSACNGFKNDGVMIAAASDAFWNGGSACGSTYKVKCVSATNNGVPHPCKGDGTIVVRIVDYCPAGCRGTIDLSQEVLHPLRTLMLERSTLPSKGYEGMELPIVYHK